MYLMERLKLIDFALPDTIQENFLEQVTQAATTVVQEKPEAKVEVLKHLGDLGVQIKMGPSQALREETKQQPVNTLV